MARWKPRLNALGEIATIKEIEEQDRQVANNTESHGTVNVKRDNISTAQTEYTQTVTPKTKTIRGRDAFDMGSAVPEKTATEEISDEWGKTKAAAAFIERSVDTVISKYSDVVTAIPEAVGLISEETGDKIESKARGVLSKIKKSLSPTANLAKFVSTESGIEYIGDDKKPRSKRAQRFDELEMAQHEKRIGRTDLTFKEELAASFKKTHNDSLLNLMAVSAGATVIESLSKKISRTLDATVTGVEMAGLDRTLAPFVSALEKASDTTGGLADKVDSMEQQVLRTLGEKHGMPVRMAAQAYKTVTDTYFELQVLKGIGIGYAGMLGKAGRTGQIAQKTRPQLVFKALKRAAAISSFRFVTDFEKDQTWKERGAKFLVGMAYMATPGMSGQFNKTWISKIADMALNAGISRGTGHDKALANAAQLAKQEGNDKNLFAYQAMAMIELYGSDIVFGAMTKSYKESGQLMPPKANKAIAKFLGTEVKVAQELTNKMGQADKIQNGEPREVPDFKDTQEGEKYGRENYQDRALMKAKGNALRERIAKKQEIDESDKERREKGTPTALSQKEYNTKTASIIDKYTEKFGEDGLGGAISANDSILRKLIFDDPRAKPDVLAQKWHDTLTELGLKVGGDNIIDQESHMVTQANVLREAVDEADRVAGVFGEIDSTRENARAVQSVLRTSPLYQKKADTGIRVGGEAAEKPTEFQQLDKTISGITDQMTPKFLSDLAKQPEVAKIQGEADLKDFILPPDASAKPVAKDVTTSDILNAAYSEYVRIETAKGNVPDSKILADAVDVIKASTNHLPKEDILMTINVNRFGGGKALILDTKTPALSKQGYIPTPEEKELFMSLRPNTISEEAMDKAIGFMRSPPPKEEKALRNYLAAMTDTAIQYQATSKRPKEAKSMRNLLWWKDQLMKAQDMRYNINSIDLATGSPQGYQLTHKIQNGTRHADFDMTQVMDTNMSKAGFKAPKIAGMQSKNKSTGEVSANKRLEWLQSTDQEINNAMANMSYFGRESKQYEKVLADLRKSHPKDADKIADYVDRETEYMTNGGGSVMLRIGQVIDFTKDWDENGKKWLPFIQDKMGESLTQEGLKKISNFEPREIAKLMSSLPAWSGDSGKTGIVDVNTMIRLSQTLMSKGESALMQEIMNMPKFGIREHWWATDKAIEESLQIRTDDGFRQSAEQYKVEKATDTTKTTKKREFEQEVILTSRPHLDVMRKHMNDIARKAYTGRDGVALQRYIRQNSDIIPQSHIDGIDKWLGNAWGVRKVAPNDITKGKMFAQKWFWNPYALGLANILRFNGRNVSWQGAPWGPINAYWNARDVAGSYGRILGQKFSNTKIGEKVGWPNKHSRLNQYQGKEFARDVNQAKTHYKEHILQEGADTSNIRALERYKQVGISGPDASKAALIRQKIALRAGSAVSDLASFGLGIGDTYNRFFTSSLSYSIAESKIEKILREPDKFGQGYFEDAIKMKTMILGEQNQIRMMYAEAEKQAALTDNMDAKRDAFEPMIQEIAQQKTIKINGDYSRLGKSGIEQDPNSRFWLSLATYPRLRINQVMTDGIAPMRRAIRNVAAGGELNKENLQGFGQGMRATAAIMVSSTLATAFWQQVGGTAFDWVTDEPTAEYDPRRVLQWAPNAIGGNFGKWVGDFMELAYNVAVKDWDTAKNVLEKKVWGQDIGSILYSVMQTPGMAMELYGNAEGQENVMKLGRWLQGKQGELTQEEYELSTYYRTMGILLKNNAEPDETTFLEKIERNSILPEGTFEDPAGTFEDVADDIQHLLK